jgi:hypothetical protein
MAILRDTHSAIHKETVLIVRTPAFDGVFPSKDCEDCEGLKLNVSAILA